MYSASVVFVRIKNERQIYYGTWFDQMLSSDRLHTMAGKKSNYIAQGLENNTAINKDSEK